MLRSISLDIETSSTIDRVRYLDIKINARPMGHQSVTHDTLQA